MQEKIYRVKDFYKRDKKLILLSIAIGLIIAFGMAFQERAYSEIIQQRISQEIIRFHILANSNTYDDQQLKMEVKKEVLSRLEPKLKFATNVNETRQVLRDNLVYIEEIVREIVQNDNYGVSVSISNVMFPEIAYQNMTLPAGEYEALQISIGAGSGENWWCVMFPMLCFISSAKGEVSEEMKNEMKNILTEEDYNFIFQDTVDIRFRSLELWQNRFGNKEGDSHVF